MTYPDSIKAILEADSALLALLTGGVYLYRDLNNGEINRDTVPDAYDGNGLLQPLASIKGRAEVPTSDLSDYGSKTVGLKQTVEIWLYADAAAGWVNLELAGQRVYELLQYEQLPGSFDMSLSNVMHDERDPVNGDACFVRLDFLVTGYRATS